MLLQDLELTTPVLEKENEFKAEKNPLLPLSQVWILSTTLPALYTQPILHSKPTPNCFNTQNFLSKFVSFLIYILNIFVYLGKHFLILNLNYTFSVPLTLIRYICTN